MALFIKRIIAVLYGVTSAYKAGCKVIMVPDLTEPDEELKKMLYARCDTLPGIKELIR